MKARPLFVTFLLAAAPLAHAGIGPDNVESRFEERSLVGVWEFTVFLRNCATGVALPVGRAQTVFHAGGTLTETNASPVGQRGIGFGEWRAEGRGEFAGMMQFYRYGATGLFDGPTYVALTWSLQEDGTLTGTSAGELINPAGTVLARICGTNTARRVR